jgi:mRNA interferase RelE/StbE
MKTKYSLFIEPDAFAVRKLLPGNVRQRIRQIIEDLAEEPRPHISESLDISGLSVPAATELRRIRVERWRVIYAVNDDERWVWVWAIRQRPPYDYEDLEEFARRL